MMNLEKLFAKARRSGFWMWVLNKALQRIIPFNKPHRIVVSRITDNVSLSHNTHPIGS